MLTIASRPYTDAELDEYSGRMVTGRAYSMTVIVLIGVIVGVVAMLAAYGAHWLYAQLTSGAVTWMISLIVGGAAAVVAVVVLWLTSNTDEWTENPPELATDVTATASAAWRMESEGLDVVYVLRIEADRYLLITENDLTPPLLGEPASGAAETIPANISLVLLGEGEFRIAMNVSLSGPAIPLKRVAAMAAATDPDRFDETPVPDGLYTTGELPARIRGAIGVG